MTPEVTSPPERRRRSMPWWPVASALLLVGTACLVVGLQTHPHPLAGPVEPSPHRWATPTTSGTEPGTEPTSPTVAGPVVARSVPTSLSIPAIGVSVSLSALGLNPTGTVQVPTDYQQPGWYDLGPSPGQEGSSVILGHVDTVQGPAIFFNLRTLQAGDEVVVTLADSVVTTFQVNTVTMYLKTTFPAQEVYGTHGDSALQLVTCGGTFDTQTGHYLSNVVVYSTLLTSTPAPTSTAVATTYWQR
jgi:LPXTG-site transpeptidase (sortase) family protein